MGKPLPRRDGDLVPPAGDELQLLSRAVSKERNLTQRIELGIAHLGQHILLKWSGPARSADFRFLMGRAFARTAEPHPASWSTPRNARWSRSSSPTWLIPPAWVRGSTPSGRVSCSAACS